MLVSCEQNNSDFTIEGTMERPASFELSLYRLGSDKTTLVDSCFSTDKGNFKLKGNATYTNFYLIKYKDEKIFLAVKPGDKITIHIDNALERPSYYVEGSTDCELIREITFRQDRVLSRITELSLQYEQSKARPESFLTEKQRIDTEYEAILAEHKNFTSKFIYDNPKSIANILALYQNFGRKNQPLFDKYLDIEIFNFVNSNLITLYPSTDAVVALNTDVTQINELIRFNKKVSQQIEIGKPVPRIKDAQFLGDTLTHFYLEHKLTVLCFWASWNKNSSAAMLELNNLQDKFASKNIRFLGISLDSSPKHLQNFINDNQIKIPIICDLHYWDSKYVSLFFIRSIPDIMIVNNRGLLVSKETPIDQIEASILELTNNQ